MSNRAKEASVIAYPQKDKSNKKGTGHYDPNFQRRKAYQQGYEQAEKDTIERAIKFIETFTHPDDVSIRNTLVKAFLRHMEEE